MENNGRKTAERIAVIDVENSVAISTVSKQSKRDAMRDDMRRRVSKREKNVTKHKKVLETSLRGKGVAKCEEY